MNAPLRAEHPLNDRDWRSVRLQAIFDCCKWDPQSGDRSVLARFPIVLARGEWERLAGWAEALTTEALAAERELLGRPRLLRRLGLPRLIQRLLQEKAATPGSVEAARVMRFDFHFTTDGWRISEVNADVPGGFIEAGGFTEQMAAYYPGMVSPPNPACAYAEEVRRGAVEGGTVALVHATAHSDDHQVMRYLAKFFRGQGLRTCLVSPAHLEWDSGLARVACRFAAGTPSMLVRFFPAEWLAKLRPKEKWAYYFVGGRTPSSNPGTSLILQSKRFPLTWEALDTPLPTWRALLPETKSPSQVQSRSNGEWVLKPALGRVGEDVGIRGVTRPREWRGIQLATWLRPQVWAAQRRFEHVPILTEHGNVYPSVGVFTVAGRAAGAYARAGRKPLIDQEAQDVAVLLEGNGCR